MLGQLQQGQGRVMNPLWVEEPGGDTDRGSTVLYTLPCDCKATCRGDRKAYLLSAEDFVD